MAAAAKVAQEPRWRRRPLAQRVLLGLGAALVALPLSSLVLDYARDPRHLPLRSIQVTGALRHLERDQLEAVVAGAIDGNFFTVDMPAIRRRVRQLAWVDEVSIRRVWPETLVMEVIEQVPVARWGARALVNDRGQVFEPESGVSHAGLVTLYGPDGSAPRAVEFYRVARARLHGAGLEVRRLGLDERRDWVVELTNGMRLALGQEAELLRLDRFLLAYPLLTADPARVPVRIDLRYAQGFAVSWRARVEEESRTAASKAREGDA